MKNRPDEWNALAHHAGVIRDNLLLLRQAHGKTIVAARSGRTKSWVPPAADAIITDDPSAAVVVRVADCAPILLVDARRGMVAAVHAGWRGTMQRIAEGAVGEMARQFSADPADLRAAIGPSLGVCCAEMGEEVVQAFRIAGHGDDDLGRWFVRAQGKRPHFDLCTANRDQLVRAGVPLRAIHVAGLCTRTHSDVFHSYRAEGAGAGRMAAVIRVPFSLRTGPDGDDSIR